MTAHDIRDAWLLADKLRSQLNKLYNMSSGIQSQSLSQIKARVITIQDELRLLVGSKLATEFLESQDDDR